MSQSKQIAWNVPEHAEGPAVPKPLFLKCGAACGERKELCAPPRLQTCSSAAGSPKALLTHPVLAWAAAKSWKVLSWPGHPAQPVMIGAGWRIINADCTKIALSLLALPSSLLQSDSDKVKIGIGDVLIFSRFLFFFFFLNSGKRQKWAAKGAQHHQEISPV